jgi:hypothetical protein
MSSEVLLEKERMVDSAVNSHGGITWGAIADILGFKPDISKAVREKTRRMVNAWVAKKYGRGGSKKVYSVWSPILCERVFKTLEFMDMEELVQVSAHLDKEEISVRRKQVKINSLMTYIDMLKRQKLIFGSNGAETAAAKIDAITKSRKPGKRSQDRTKS